MRIALGGLIHYDGQSEKTLHWFQQEPERDLLCSVSGEMVSKCFPPTKWLICTSVCLQFPAALVKHEVGVIKVIT